MTDHYGDFVARHILTNRGRCLLCDKKRDVDSSFAAPSPDDLTPGHKESLASRSLLAEQAHDQGTLRLPGFGLPVTHNLRCEKGYPHAVADMGLVLSSGVSLRERRMMDFIGTITDKPGWDRKVFDEAIVGKWREEAMAMPRVEDNDVYMSDKMFNNCIAELRDKASRFKELGFVNVLDAEVTVVKSDTAIPQSLAARLRAGVQPLEDVPETQKDWHPRSDNQVLDLLHPSLFPVVYGRTRALREGVVPLDDSISYIGKGEQIAAFPREAGVPAHWGSYQWLPSDVHLTESGPKICSYINNLHPSEHRALYGVLEEFVAAAIPLWEESLSWWTDRRRFLFRSTDDEDDFILPEGVTYVPPPRSDNGEDEEPQSPQGYPDEYKWTDHYMDFWEANRVLTFHEPEDFTPLAEKVDLSARVDFKREFPQGLQVIFKLANIHLDPEDPEYGGGSWHVEGALNEQICATALYYYDEENITPSRLAFRQGIDAEKMIMIPMQSAFTSLEKYMGVVNEEPAVQNLGSVLTSVGRLLVFPNALQHQVQPFKLEDTTRPGHRKILAMFLIDPNRRILSTANVPPQRKDWWAPLVRDIPAFARLPLEIFDHIMDLVDEFPISWEDALKIREDLMDERTNIGASIDEALEEITFSFCEH